MRRILVIDDEVAVRAAIGMLLEHYGFTVELAEGAAATEVAGFKCAGALGDQAVEATYLLDVTGVHSLTLVREVLVVTRIHTNVQVRR